MSEQQKKTPESKARASALGSLAMREHSCAELRTKLLNKNHDEAIVDRLIVELLEHDYVSDQRFAESYWRSRSAKGYGVDRISRELSQKGVSAAVIEQARAEADIDFYAVVESVYHKKYHNISSRAKIERNTFLWIYVNHALIIYGFCYRKGAKTKLEK